MLELNLLVIMFITIASMFIIFSKNNKNTQRKYYLLVNLVVGLWEALPFFITFHSTFFKIVFDWSPLILLPLLHRETALLSAAFYNTTYDDLFIKLEKKYFPSIMTMHAQNRMNHTFFSEFLHFCYLSFYVLIYGIPLYFYIRHEFLEFYVTTFAILFLLFTCYITHALIPVHGPRNIFEKINDHRSQGSFFRLVHKILEDTSTAGTAFPSGHTGVACVTLLVTFYLDPYLFLCILPFALGLIVSTIYGRFHYVLDLIFGGVYALIAFLVTLEVYY